MLRGVFLDMHGTLGYVENPITPVEIAELLVDSGYEVSPQAWRVASHFVGIVDFPKLKFPNEHSYLRHVCFRLGIEIDEETLNRLVELFKRREYYKLYPEAIDAVKTIRELGLKIAIATTIPKFRFKLIIEALSPYIDFVMTGAEAECDKSNPKMYLKLLRILKLTPESVVVVGDEDYVDVILPKKLGMRAIQIIRENGKKCKLADAYVTNLIDAAKIIEKWIREEY
ncbi:MAG: hypothetical protein DRO15_01000 [Thermoprotei archaeon]|nr:MAG: hypothetical protein DRO15_01000 [Thermoprotei archaeon]